MEHKGSPLPKSISHFSFHPSLYGHIKCRKHFVLLMKCHEQFLCFVAKVTVWLGTTGTVENMHIFWTKELEIISPPAAGWRWKQLIMWVFFQSMWEHPGALKKNIRKISITSQIRLKWRLVNGSMPEHSGKHSCHSGNPSNTLYYIKKEIRFYPHPKISLYILKILSPSHYFSMYRNRAPHRHILK